MEFTDYLSNKVAPSTAKRYNREVELFFLFQLKEKSRHPKEATYQDVMDYLGQLRKTQQNLSCSLHGIKNYYKYLVVTGERKDNPAKSIRLRDKQSREVQLQDLFKPEELEQLLDKKERYPILKNRNRIILSLFIYQGLTNGEITDLTLSNINLEEGTIYIKQGRKTNSRTLKLQSKQVYWLMEYIHKDRPQLLKVETNNLIISKLGTEETGEGISYLVETQKHLFPERKLNAKTIRQSVITNMLKSGHDLRVVQTFAGHRYPSATEQYKQTQVEELKQQILKYHPLQ
ncbi:MAG: tyrosine-type recombinase/integrase [Flavobacteriales bacterium]|nr:tyrosine-type recombinase/integrase [Flavobacteriales bacterium]